MKDTINFVIILLLFASCGNEINQSSQELTLHEQLTILDGNIKPDTNDVKVIRIKTLLEDLSVLYDEPKDTIAEWTSKAQGALHDSGIKESNLDILEEINKVGKIENTSYKEAITLYTLIRSNSTN